MTDWQGRTAVITGAASGFGLETSRLAAQAGMNVVMADVQAEAARHGLRLLRRFDMPANNLTLVWGR